MNRIRGFVTALLLVGIATLWSCDGREVADSSAQEPNIAAATDLDGRRVSPFEFEPGTKARCIIFVMPDCPIANGYSPAIAELRKNFETQAVDFMLVHVDPDTTVERARTHAADFGHERMTILLDDRHTLVDHCGVTITPEAVVITADGEIAYRGRIDNWYGDLGRKRPRATRHDLRDALDAVLKGKTPPVARTEAVGCNVPPL